MGFVWVANVSRAADSPPELKIDINFPGGSAEVLKIDQERRFVRIVPSHHKDRGWECWWHFQVTGVQPGEELTIEAGPAPWATPDRCCFSLDGKTWKQTAPGERIAETKTITYTQQIDGDSAWFAWGPPFVPEDAAALVKEAAERCDGAEAFELCETRAGRSTPALRIKAPGVPDKERLGIWVQARQHAWESGSSWVCKGFVDWITSDDERAAELRRRSEIVIVPIMDIDNVAIGAGGKNQVPQDHNRDWSDEPYWRSVAAAQYEILKLHDEGRFDLFVDLHNPGANSKNPFFYIPPRDTLSATGNRQLDRFLAAAKEEMIDPLGYKGETQESGGSYDKNWQQISKNWVSRRCGEPVVAVTLETAWNTEHGVPSGYEHVGRGLGQAMERYFRAE
jgi:hypothetical protein